MTARRTPRPTRQRLWVEALRERDPVVIEFTERAVLKLGRYGTAELLGVNYETFCMWISGDKLVRDLRPKGVRLDQLRARYQMKAERKRHERRLTA